MPGEGLVGWMGGADVLVDVLWVDVLWVDVLWVGVLWVGVRMDAEVMADNG